MRCCKVRACRQHPVDWLNELSGFGRVAEWQQQEARGGASQSLSIRRPVRLANQTAGAVGKNTLTHSTRTHAPSVQQ